MACCQPFNYGNGLLPIGALKYLCMYYCRYDPTGAAGNASTPEQLDTIMHAIGSDQQRYESMLTWKQRKVGSLRLSQRHAKMALTPPGYVTVAHRLRVQCQSLQPHVTPLQWVLWLR